MDGSAAVVVVRTFVIRTPYKVLGKIGSRISDVVLEQRLEGFPGLRKRAVVGVAMVDCGERIQERASDNDAQSCLPRRQKVYLAWLTFIVLSVYTPGDASALDRARCRACQARRGRPGL
jgi:hypothetical protein